MEPYIYFNEDEFSNDKKYTLRFGKEHEIQKVFFSPEKKKFYNQYEIFDQIKLSYRRIESTYENSRII